MDFMTRGREARESGFPCDESALCVAFLRRRRWDAGCEGACLAPEFHFTHTHTHTNTRTYALMAPHTYTGARETVVRVQRNLSALEARQTNSRAGCVSKREGGEHTLYGGTETRKRKQTETP